MSVTSVQRLVQYTQSTVGESFAVPFYFFAATDLAVYMTRDGVDTLLVNVTDYTVANAGTNPSTATVLLAAGLADDIVTIYGNMPATQSTTLTNNGPLPAATLTQQVDRLTMLCQQLAYSLGNAFRFALTAAAVNPLNIEDFKAMILGFDENGLPEAVDPLSLGVNRIQSFQYPITSGTQSVDVFFPADFTAIPRVITATVGKPTADADNISASIVEDSKTIGGCTIELNGAPSATGYVLNIIAIA